MSSKSSKRARREAATGTDQVELKHTFEFTCKSSPIFKSTRSSSFMVAHFNPFSPQLGLSGGPSIECSVDFHPSLSYFEFTINWPEAILKCSTEAFILKNGEKKSLGKFDCTNGKHQRVDVKLVEDDDEDDDDDDDEDDEDDEDDDDEDDEDDDDDDDDDDDEDDDDDDEDDDDDDGDDDDNFPLTIFLDVSATGSVVPPSHVSAHNLSVDYEELLNSDLFSDVEVKCGGRTFKCHKGILAKRSEVFAAMLSSNFMEGQNNAIKVKEMDPNVLQIMLLYIYSGKIEEKNISVALFRAAHLYNVGGLAKDCCSALAKDLNLKNCCEVLEMSHLYSNKSLFDRAIRFFREHKDELMTSDEWKRTERNGSLMSAIMRQMY